MSHFDPSTKALHNGLATELRRIRVELEHLAELLVGDPHFIANYLDQLQLFDFLGQCTDETAAVLDRLAEGVDATTAIALVRLDVMVDRLRENMAAAPVHASDIPRAA